MFNGSIRRLVVLGGVLALIVAAMALTSGTAAAQPFCAGANVGPNNPCFGGARILTIVRGKGNTHAICVGADSTRGQCVPPNTWASWNSGSTGNKVPWIEYNPPGTASTIVSGERNRHDVSRMINPRSMTMRVSWRTCASSLALLAALAGMSACGTSAAPTAVQRGPTGQTTTATRDVAPAVTITRPDRAQLHSFALLRTRPEGLPVATRRLLVSGRFGVNWDLAQRIPVDFSGAYWLVPGKGYLCIVSQIPTTPGAGMACNETWRARMEGLATISFSTENGTSHPVREMVGVTRDGARSVLVHTGAAVKSIPVVDGIFALRDSAAAPPDRLTVR